MSQDPCLSVCSCCPVSAPPSFKEPHWWQLQLSSVSSIPKINGQVFLMETVTWNDCYRPKLPQSIFDPWSCTRTLSIWDKVPINTTLHSPHICDIQAPRTTQPWTDEEGSTSQMEFLGRPNHLVRVVQLDINPN